MSEPIKKPPLKANPILPKVWVTKYALTKGVYTVENVVHWLNTDGRGIVIHYKTPGGYIATQYIYKPHWHTTEDEARAQVQKMVGAAVKSLMRKKAKLEALMAQLTESVPTKPWGT